MKSQEKRLSMKGLSKDYLKWAAYGLILILTTIVQALPHGLPTIAGGRPLLMIPVVVCIAMFEGPVDGAIAGMAGGLLWDLFSDRLLGFNALILLILCCACGLLSQLLIRNNLISSMLMVCASLIVQGVLDWFFNHVLVRQPEPLYALLHLTIPRIVYTLVLTPLLYLVVYAVCRFLRSHN